MQSVRTASVAATLLVALSNAADIVSALPINTTNTTTKNGDLDFAFATHLAQYGITYETKEDFEMRKNLFAQTDALIREHNESNEEPMSYTLAHNLFSDMTEEERDGMLGLNRIAPLDGP